MLVSYFGRNGDQRLYKSKGLKFGIRQNRLWVKIIEDFDACWCVYVRTLFPSYVFDAQFVHRKFRVTDLQS